MPKIKRYMHFILGEIGICKSCFREISQTDDMTFEGKEFVDFVISPFIYEGIVAEIVRKFKFGREKRLGEFVTEVAYYFIKDTTLFEGYDMLIPVPLHSKRLDERTFNQSTVIAETLGRLSGITVVKDALIRTRNTLHQSSLKGVDRVENVSGAFAVNGIDFTGKKIILVDDIYTMGETANECARMLKNAGAEKVVAFALCKTVIKNKYWFL